MKATECPSWLTVLMCCEKKKNNVSTLPFMFASLWDQEWALVFFFSFLMFQFDTISPCAWQSTQWFSISANGLIHTFHAIKCQHLYHFVFLLAQQTKYLNFHNYSNVIDVIIISTIGIFINFFLDIFWLIFSNAVKVPLTSKFFFA